jgi:hypothetical protein
MELASKGFSHGIWFTNTNSTYYVLALASIAPRQGTCQHHQAYWLSAKKTPSTEKVFLMTSQMLVLAPAQYKKKLFFFRTIAFFAFDKVCASRVI